MAPLLVKLILSAMFIVGFMPFALSSEIVAIDCRKIMKVPCPSYCPKTSRPSKLNPTNLWGIPCLCCDLTSRKKHAPTSQSEVEILESASSSEQPQLFKPDMIVIETNVKTVSTESRDKLIDKLVKLNEVKMLPPEELMFWTRRIHTTQDDLLSPDEVELLTILLFDCGVSLTSAYFLVQPLSVEQNHPAPSNFGMRGGFQTEKPFSFEDLKKQLEGVDVQKVNVTIGDENKVIRVKSLGNAYTEDDSTEGEDNTNTEGDGDTTAGGDTNFDIVGGDENGTLGGGGSASTEGYGSTNTGGDINTDTVGDAETATPGVDANFH